MKRPLLFLLLLCSLTALSQQQPSVAATKWVDSVFRTLSEDEKIGQLMTLRLSSIDGRKVVYYDQQVKDAIRKYNIGGITLFQGGPLKQASLINELQKMAKTPLLVSIDGETGVGMRMDSVVALPRQMMLGAVNDASIIYEYGRLVGEQCKRIGIHINYAPVVDINNNPANPVINDRSFGEEKYKVALFGMQYMRGMQDVGVMACAKHFPGHGDVAVDSHYDLPVIEKSRAQLDSLELYPFRQIINAGVGAVMVAHLAVPAIERKSKVPTSISYDNITGLLRNELGFRGLILTDALEMKGVSKFYSPAELSVKAIQAGNDMLCLPGDIDGSVRQIKEAIRKDDLSWEEIDERVKRVLFAKYQYGLAALRPIQLDNLTEDLNAKTEAMRRLIAQNAITLLRNDEPSVLPLKKDKRIAFVGVGLTNDNVFASQLRNDYGAHVYYFDYGMDTSMIEPMLKLLKNRYDVVVVGVHKFSRVPAKGFGISPAAIRAVNQIQQRHKTITVVFGNAYAAKNFCESKTLVQCYEDDDITQSTAVDMLGGRFTARGKLPVTVCTSLKYGQGITATSASLPRLRPSDVGFNIIRLTAIDSIVNDAISQRAIPGASVLVAKDGRIAYDRAFGYLGYDSLEAVYPETIYDLASLTKIMATTISVMKLYDEGKLDLHKTLGDYLTWTRGTNKAKLPLWDILLHQAGLKAWIPFYRETLDPKKKLEPIRGIYSPEPNSSHSVRVAENFYMRNDWRDTIYKRILQSSVSRTGVYVYSDLDFIFLGNIVEKISGMSLDQYVKKTFYDTLGLRSTSFVPRKYFPVENIAPTETEAIFRRQMLRGDVHDPGAAMFGGVAGHAGLFSNIYDLAVLSQMLLNGGEINGIRFFRPQTVQLFTQYHSTSRRGLGFDKPEKDNLSRVEPYPTASASPLTFGHTGFTGTCIWIDPAQNLIFVFLSNRVYNNGDPNRFGRLSVRPKVHETIYAALGASTTQQFFGQLGLN